MTAPSAFFFCGTKGNHLYLLATQLDLKRIAGPQAQLGVASLSRD